LAKRFRIGWNRLRQEQRFGSIARECSSIDTTIMVSAYPGAVQPDFVCAQPANKPRR